MTFQGRKEDDGVVKAGIMYGYMLCDEELYKYVIENKIVSRGTCCLTATYYNNTYYLANAGDSSAVLISTDPEDSTSYITRSLTEEYNCMNPLEQIRLLQDKQSHRVDSPEELEKRVKDLFRYKRSFCWIKGYLMPSRSLGDFHLKVYIVIVNN